VAKPRGGNGHLLHLQVAQLRVVERLPLLERDFGKSTGKRGVVRHAVPFQPLAYLVGGEEPFIGRGR